VAFRCSDAVTVAIIIIIIIIIVIVVVVVVVVVVLMLSLLLLCQVYPVFIAFNKTMKTVFRVHMLLE